jgi:hypothetical protein
MGNCGAITGEAKPLFFSDITSTSAGQKGTLLSPDAQNFFVLLVLPLDQRKKLISHY